ncbi:MAG: dihydroneopterin aldolase [Myxococcota bacterium]
MSMSSTPHPDRIVVHGIRFTGYHGVFDEERRDGRRFRVDLEVDLLEGHRAHQTDRLEDAVDYRGLAATIMEVAQGPSIHLIEHLAETMCSRLLERHPIGAVALTLQKFVPDLPGDPEHVAVSIRRQRSAQPSPTP